MLPQAEDASDYMFSVAIVNRRKKKKKKPIYETLKYIGDSMTIDLAI